MSGLWGRFACLYFLNITAGQSWRIGSRNIPWKVQKGFLEICKIILTYFHHTVLASFWFAFWEFAWTNVKLESRKQKSKVDSHLISPFSIFKHTHTHKKNTKKVLNYVTFGCKLTEIQQCNLSFDLFTKYFIYTLFFYFDDHCAIKTVELCNLSLRSLTLLFFSSCLFSTQLLQCNVKILEGFKLDIEGPLQFPISAAERGFMIKCFS